MIAEFIALPGLLSYTLGYASAEQQEEYQCPICRTEGKGFAREPSKTFP